MQVQADLKEVGITVELNEVPEAKYFSDSILKGDDELTSFSWQGTAFPISFSESMFYPVDSGRNFTGITDKPLGHLFTSANTELDADKHIVIANKIDRVLAASVPIIPLSSCDFVPSGRAGRVR